MTGPVFAAAKDEIAAPALRGTVGTGDIVNVGVSLFVVIGAIVVCGWFYTRSQGLRGRTGDVFRIVATQALGPKERIVVIEVANKQLVLGMTASQISTLHVFDEPVVAGQERRFNVRSEGTFAERFKSILKGNGK